MSLPTFTHTELPRPSPSRPSKYPLDSIIMSSEAGKARCIEFEAALEAPQEQAFRNTMRESLRRRGYKASIKKLSPTRFSVWVSKNAESD